MNRVLAFADRNRKEILRDPLSYIFCLAFPLAMLVVMTLVNASIPKESGMTVFRIDNLAEEVGALLHGHLEDIVAGRHRQRGTEALYGLVSVSRDLNHVLRSGTRLGERIGCLLEQPELVGGGGVLENVLGFLGRRDRIIRFVLPVLAAGTSA